MMPENDEDVEHPEASGRNDKEIDGGNAGRVVLKECPPGLTGRPPASHHVLGDSRLTDLDPELEQLTMDTGCTP
jgi:hypothetical protein